MSNQISSYVNVSGQRITPLAYCAVDRLSFGTRSGEIFTSSGALLQLPLSGATTLLIAQQIQEDLVQFYTYLKTSRLLISPSSYWHRTWHR